ncbi:MAG: V-type ATPase 116kDa subunit family protein [bacterium]|nr:V-type ATPase 116kDa subunit family protein [bacterium]
MAVAKLKKILLVTHKDSEKEILERLKTKFFVEIRPFTLNVENDVDIKAKKFNENVKILENSLEVINKYKGIFKYLAKQGKVVVKRSEYLQISKNEKILDIAKDIVDTDKKIEEINSKIKNLKSEINHLAIWNVFTGKLEDLKDFGNYTLLLGKINLKNIKKEEFEKSFEGKNLSVEELNTDGDFAYYIIGYLNSEKESVEELLLKSAFENAIFENMSGTIEENILLKRDQIKHTENDKKKLSEKIKILMEKYEKEITVYLEYSLEQEKIYEIFSNSYKTEKTSFYTLWIKQEDFEKIKGLKDDFKYVEIFEIELEEGEEPPIILENKKVLKPFEMVTSMFGVPRYYEIDPTPFIGVFFGLFFGLCITDAIYGLILMILTLILLIKIPKTRGGLIQLMFYGGFWTFIMGALFSGWFGDLPNYINLGKYTSKIALLGDPVNTFEGAMNFFRLSLLLGVFHIMFGLSIKFFDNIFKKDYQTAFFDSFVWITYIGSVILMFLGTEMAVSMDLVKKPLVSMGVVKVLGFVTLISALIIIIFSNRNEKSWFMRIFMGILNATIVGGLSSYVGDILSYIRLMALGLTSAGIGVAINKIAFSMTEIKFLGPILTVIVLLFGHLFNLAINLLGGFVHTLRLHFVEFFNKFYSGGGIPFREFKEEYKYITIIED